MHCPSTHQFLSQMWSLLKCIDDKYRTSEQLINIISARKGSVHLAFWVLGFQELHLGFRVPRRCSSPGQARMQVAAITRCCARVQGSVALVCPPEACLEQYNTNCEPWWERDS